MNAQHSAADPHHAGKFPNWSYFAIWILLIILTVTTAAAAEIDLGRFNIVLALAIAVLKASIVAWFFMHVKAATPLTRLLVIAGLIWLFIFFNFVFTDYFSRLWVPEGAAWSTY